MTQKELGAEPNFREFGILSMDVLDHGYVALRNVSGPTRRAVRQGVGFDAADCDPAQAARMSFGQMGSERTLAEDLKLSRYLLKNRHTSPFEQVQVWLQMKLPIFVARQFVRHRTVRMNEISGRYVTLPAEWYIPETVGGKAANKKQGQEDNLPESLQTKFKNKLEDHCVQGYGDYRNAISMGVAPEHARMLLSLNHYTVWLWNQDLHNMMHFLSLRDHSHAQVEAQMYAKAITALLRMALPETMRIYDELRASREPMSRDQAVAHIRGIAAKYEDTYSYLKHPDDPYFMPHEWVIEAVMKARQ